MRVLVGLTGSVAAIRAPRIAKELLARGCEVRLVTTHSALHFFRAEELPPGVELVTDETEWSAWSKIGDPVVHIQLRDWADVFVIAPLSANTLGKLANGLCDNLLTCVARAWKTTKPMIVAPAMNTAMWEHPFTAKHLEVLGSLGIRVIPPVSKRLACGDIGQGGLADVETIVSTVLNCRPTL
eukprot:m51a1_g7725 putative phosphopantothenoylcysteine decarboxylase (183) ;mRNA; f:152878-153689